MKKSRQKKILLLILLTTIILILSLIIFLLSIPNVADLEKSNPKITAMIKQRIQEAKRKKSKFKIKQKWINIKKIPKLLITGVVITEDASFFSHNGIDYYELKESIKKNLKQGKKARGGSTITQQLAKNLYLSTRKSYIRKIKEFLIAKKMEECLTKQRILEIYLNVIEFGRGIFGVEAASLHFFKKSVSKLSLSEILRLIAVIPKPLRVNPLSNSGYLKWRVNFILKKLEKFNYINKETYKKLFIKTEK